MLSILAAVLAAAPLGAAKAPDARPVSLNGAVCQIVDIGSPQAPRHRRSFSATRILDLEFQTLLQRRVKGEHALQLRVYTPRGFLYQVLSVPFETPTGKKPITAVDGSAGGRWADRWPRRLEARLPVAGTSIMASALYGRWRVVPHLDDRPAPCGPGRSFVIKP